MPEFHKLYNWPSYNASVKQRGNVFFFIDEKIFVLHNQRINNTAMLFLYCVTRYNIYINYPIVKPRFFLESLRKHTCDILSKIPNYTTMYRRLKSLNISLQDHRKEVNGDSIVVIDSTRVSIYNMYDLHGKRDIKAMLTNAVKSGE